jgi:molybdopterin-guanine dinucleotide biosynthesis protein A
MSQRYRDIAGCVLAGGRNSRMGGTDKCLMMVEGVPLIQRVFSVLGEVFEELLLVTDARAGGSSPRHLRYGELPGCVQVREDLYQGRGPLGGIHAALSACTGSAMFCVACDMPHLEAGLIRRQVESFRALECDALVPRTGELIEPLHALYRKSLEREAARILARGGGYSVRLLLAAADTRYMELCSEAELQVCFTNLNTPGDFHLLREGRARA